MFGRVPKSMPITFVALAIGVFVPAAQAGVPLTRISADPFTNSTSQHLTEVEPDSFAYGSTIVAAFQQGRFADEGSSDLGFATSTDGGTTWAHGSLPLTTFSGGTFDRASDPSVAYDAKADVWLISSVALHTYDWSVAVDLSTDGGHTWGDPVTVALGTAQTAFDKPWITCDNTPTSVFFGNCYLVWDDAAANQRVELSTSSDGGLTWGAANTPANSPDAIGGQPVVQPDGTVVVPITDSSLRLSSFRSIDGGANWSSESRIAVPRAPALAGGLRAGFALSSAGIDQSGRIYVAWQDCRFRPHCSRHGIANGGANDIVYSTSVDGIAWSPARRIPIAPVKSSVDAFLPALAVDASTEGSHAHLALTYYYYPQANCEYPTCNLDVGFVSSINSGATWSAPKKLAGPMKLSWLAQTIQGPMVGDYISTSFTSDGLAHGVFAVAKPPNGAGYHEAIYTPSTGLQPAFRCVVPDVVGRRLRTARTVVGRHNCRTGTVRRIYARNVTKGRVIAQTPKPSTVLAPGGKVSLVVSRGKRP